jgi:hypothetical protein
MMGDCVGFVYHGMVKPIPIMSGKVHWALLEGLLRDAPNINGQGWDPSMTLRFKGANSTI